MTMGRRGARSKLTPAVHEAVIEVIESGGTYQAAADASGVSTDSIRRWRGQGARARSGKFADFCRDFEAAEARAISKVEDVLYQSITDGILEERKHVKIEREPMYNANGQPLRDADGRVLYQEGRRIEEVHSQRTISHANLRWFLERRAPDRFPNVSKLEHSGAIDTGGPPPPVEIRLKGVRTFDDDPGDTGPGGPLPPMPEEGETS